MDCRLVEGDMEILERKGLGLAPPRGGGPRSRGCGIFRGGEGRIEAKRNEWGVIRKK